MERASSVLTSTRTRSPHSASIASVGSGVMLRTTTTAPSEQFWSAKTDDVSMSAKSGGMARAHLHTSAELPKWREFRNAGSAISATHVKSICKIVSATGMRNARTASLLKMDMPAEQIM